MIEHRILTTCLWEYFHQSKCYLNILIMFKTYFGELVLGFSPDRNKTTAENVLLAEWLKIIIRKKVEISTRVCKGA